MYDWKSRRISIKVPTIGMESVKYISFSVIYFHITWFVLVSIYHLLTKGFPYNKKNRKLRVGKCTWYIQFTDLEPYGFPNNESTHFMDMAIILTRMLSTPPSRHHEQIAECSMWASNWTVLRGKLVMCIDG